MNMEDCHGKWETQSKGDPNGNSWEISVIRSDYEHGHQSWGWFDKNKLLISHNGGPCSWPLAPGLGPLMEELAKRYCDMLNNGEINLKELKTNKALTT